MTIKILKETEKEIVGEFEEVKKDLGFTSKNKKYKVDSISDIRIVLVDENGIGRILPFLGNEHLKLNDEIELPE